ncbi:21393_t:CDS:1 [Entrophospora sp. SA101]|nr:185_t:CDS:1 [Entrophospora sp. SA101]CAJ0747162.1 21393_t:CDS:1 [Entrophospora sp. SA101]CAJ0827849.1 19644_t:CDS:1 [Entrophospora sp. SA101]CAJ0875727.1 22490_t:CDS:1 [Entrophospora sp. SA101]CAJ0901297.1 6545_t:CDS:1 [Entrophospora sp. SA101]
MLLKKYSSSFLIIILLFTITFFAHIKISLSNPIFTSTTRNLNHLLLLKNRLTLSNWSQDNNDDNNYYYLKNKRQVASPSSSSPPVTGTALTSNAVQPASEPIVFSVIGDLSAIVESNEGHMSQVQAIDEEAFEDNLGQEYNNLLLVN